jgi:hypothetical protein
MTTQRKALLDSLFQRKNKAPQAQRPTPKPDQFSVKPEMVKPGAYFWVRGKEIQPLDVTGRPYPEKIKGNQHIEATGRTKNGMIEVRFKGSRVWVLLSDLARPMQSKTVATVVTAAGSDESIYTSTSQLADFLRVMLKNGDKRELKITTKTRKALSEAMSAVLDTISDWRYSDDELTPSEYIADVCSGSQKTVNTHIQEMLKNRGAYKAGWKNSKTGKDGDTRLVDHLIAACILMASTLRGSTTTRGEFLFNNLPTAVAKAGGSGLQSAIIKAIRMHLKWSDIEKGRQKKDTKDKAKGKADKKPAAKKTTKKTKAKRKKASVALTACTDVETLLSKYTPPLVPGYGKAVPRDLVFQILRQYGPVRAWDNGALQNPMDMVTVLVSLPVASVSEPVPAGLFNQAPKQPSRVFFPVQLERSKQLACLVSDLSDSIVETARMGTIFAPHEGNVSLMELLIQYTSECSGANIGDMLNKIQSSSWYGKLVDNHGYPLKSLTSVYGLYTGILLHVALNAESGSVRAMALHSAVEAMVQFKLMPATSLAAKIRTHFPWAVVATMLWNRSLVPAGVQQ